jgi:hypothetical protein
VLHFLKSPNQIRTSTIRTIRTMVREVYNHHLLRQTAKFYQNSKTKNSKIVQKMIFFFNKKFMKSCDFKNFFNLFYYQLQLSITLLGIFL